MTKAAIRIEQDGKEVKEVKVVWDPNEVNRMLTEGWTFLRGGCAHQDSMGLQAKPVFILAKIKKG